MMKKLLIHQKTYECTEVSPNLGGGVIPACVLHQKRRELNKWNINRKRGGKKPS